MLPMASLGLVLESMSRKVAGMNQYLLSRYDREKNMKPHEDCGNFYTKVAEELVSDRYKILPRERDFVQRKPDSFLQNLIRLLRRGQAKKRPFIDSSFFNNRKIFLSLLKCVLDCLRFA